MKRTAKIALIVSAAIASVPGFSAEKQSSVDYSKPLYTTRNALICPLLLGLDKREGYGLTDALDAHRSEKPQKVREIGCQEWKAGTRIYIGAEQKNRLWQEFRTDPDDLSDGLVILGFDVTNNPGPKSP